MMVPSSYQYASFFYNGAISLYGETTETSEVFNDGQLGNGKIYHALYLVLLHHQRR
jgi:hypothetical protein